MRHLQTHLNRLFTMGKPQATVYIPATYTVTWPDGCWSTLAKSGWHWRFRDTDGNLVQYTKQADAFDAIRNLGGTYRRNEA